MSNYQNKLPKRFNIINEDVENEVNIKYNNMLPPMPKLDYTPNDNSRIWYNHYRGYIIKNSLDPITNKIVKEKISYNQPDTYLHSLDDYFRYKLN